ncbi:MAG: glycosyltransferase family 2 protein [Pseudomonadota bacterium]
MLELFVLSLIFIIFPFTIYPACLLFAGIFINKKVIKHEITPSVGFMIAAYNEEKAMVNKIENTLALDYPKDMIEIIVVSDGSTDRTDEIVRSYGHAGVKLFRVEGRLGKTEARNQAVAKNKNEIICFSDATTYYHPQALRYLVQSFADPLVGQVSGSLHYQSTKTGVTGIATRFYWWLENIIKKCQTGLGTLTGATGCINAFRRLFYTPLPAHIIEDFTQPLIFVIKGFRVVFEERAIAYEETTQNISQEFQMRVRVIRGGITGLLYARQILNPLRYPWPAFQLIGHKVIRWLTPVFILLSFGSAIELFARYPHSWPYQLPFYLSLLFVTVAALAFLLNKKEIPTKVGSIILYFLTLSAASLVAIIKSFTTPLPPTWRPQR